MSWPPDPNSLGRQQQAVDSLKIQDAIVRLANRYDPKLVMDVIRGWLVYMDAQVASDPEPAAFTVAKKHLDHPIGCGSDDHVVLHSGVCTESIARDIVRELVSRGLIQGQGTV